MLLGIQNNTNLLVYLLYHALLYATESSAVIMVTTFNELYKGMPLCFDHYTNNFSTSQRVNKEEYTKPCDNSTDDPS
jgi:hypothetical protein